ncbi:GTP-binding protein [Lactobacillaceae bacterium L1_55_11]|nr:GTP-binding protein [Lactobacillaceae bacterium L1_55_11]
MSLFSFLHSKKQLSAGKAPDPAAEQEWTTSSQPNVFFPGYQTALAGKISQGQTAEAESLRAEQRNLQDAFMDRFNQRLTRELGQLNDGQQKEAHIIKATQAVRAYNADMGIDVRTRLAQIKRQQIDQLNDENDPKLS